MIIPENERPDQLSGVGEPNKSNDYNFARAWRRYLEKVDELHLEDPKRLPTPESMATRYGDNC